MQQMHERQTAPPSARHDGLVIKALDDEVLVYDLARSKAFCLNASSAAIWRACDGRTTVGEIARRVRGEVDAPVDDAVVWYALDRLDRLGRDGLLEAAPDVPPDVAGLTRRDVIRRIGVRAAIAVPLVTALLAPSTAKAYGGGCVLADTPLLTPDGGEIAARDVVEGQLLLGARADTGELVAGPVQQLGRFDAAGFYTLMTEGGELLQCSATHLVVRGRDDEDGSTAAGLAVGDPVLVFDRAAGRAVESRIAVARYVDVPQPVLFFEMGTREHTFVSGGIVSHNRICCSS